MEGGSAMNFVNLYFGLKLIPIIIMVICVLIIVLSYFYAIIIDKFNTIKRKIIKKFSRK